MAPGPLYTSSTPVRLIDKAVLYRGQHLLHCACGLISYGMIRALPSESRSDEFAPPARVIRRLVVS